MKRNFLLLILLCNGLWLSAQTSIGGKLTDSDSGEPLLFANVALFKNGALITGTETDFDGNYNIANIDPGSYDVEASYLGYTSKRVSSVLVEAGRANKLDILMSQEGVLLTEIEVVEYKVPLIKQDETTQGKTVTAEEIRALPTRSVNTIASTTAGIASSDDGGDLNIRGSRSEGTNYYVDGIRVSSTMVPTSEIDQLQVITGGVEAQYGDVTGGIVNITTKGPSQKFVGGIEVETSEYLDDYGYNLISANFSGPILKNSKGVSRLGFRLAGQYTSREEDNPPGTPVFQVKDEQLQNLIDNPVSQLGNVLIPTAELYTNDDIDFLPARTNQASSNLNLTGRLDARVTDNIDIAFTGAFFDSDNLFTPGGSILDDNASRGWGVFNYHNNPNNHIRRYRGNVRLRHRIGKNRALLTDEEKQAQKAAVIQNLNYSLQFAYEKSLSDRNDPRHGENYFDYGYVGRFDFDYEPIFDDMITFDSVRQVFTQDAIDYRQNFTGYTPGTINPGYVNYNNLIDQGDIDEFLTRNGTINNTFTNVWGFHTNTNVVYNTAVKTDNDLYTFTASSSFDLVPSSSEKGRHNIQFGIIYEQRFNRFWSLSPSRLWEIARLSANNHITAVDTTQLIRVDSSVIFINGVPVDLLQNVYAPLADSGSSIDNPAFFWQNIRNTLGVGVNEFVNVDALTPDQLSLDMFAPIELTDQAIIGFQGFDYLGNKISDDVTFDDFWTGNFGEGLANMMVAPDKPIYSAAYIQDKFTFRDIIFRLGLRVERFDANNKVLKDPFSFYEIQEAGAFHATTGTDRPPAIGDDYKVYTTSATSNSVKAYRNGDTWFLPDGTQANSGAFIFGGEVVTPKLVNEDIRVRSPEYDINSTFEDYEPSVDWLPRLSFSFPISDVANFFAHYDVLIQRPSNNNVSALQYFYFNEPGRITTNNPINNANLRPQKTVDYAVGFQQKLTNSSALKLTAYYRELRSLIQRQTILFVPPPLNSYETYGNQDFGTVKGFTLQYDMRRTNNIQFRVDYTLQFADGTGSNADSQRGLSQRGNLRTLFPLSFDERHRFAGTFDFRYGSGKKYNGPRIAGKDILSNMGVNLILSAWSGRPYTRTRQPELLGGSGTIGSLNGARLPWSSRIDLRVDKSFSLGGPDAKFSPNFNIYLRVSNLLDQDNILAVYSATGSSTDSGFLNTSRGEATLGDIQGSGRDIQPYLDAYSWAVLNPGLFSLPRRIILGAIIDF